MRVRDKIIITSGEFDPLSKEDINLVRKNLSLKRELNMTGYKEPSKILNIPNKVCSHCGDTKWRKEKYFTKNNPDSFRYRCVNLMNEYAKNHFKKKKNGKTSNNNN